MTSNFIKSNPVLKNGTTATCNTMSNWIGLVLDKGYSFIGIWCQEIPDKQYAGMWKSETRHWQLNVSSKSNHIKREAEKIMISISAIKEAVFYIHMLLWHWVNKSNK